MQKTVMFYILIYRNVLLNEDLCIKLAEMLLLNMALGFSFILKHFSLGSCLAI